MAAGLINVAHHLGGASVWASSSPSSSAAGTAGDGPHELLAHRVSAALTAAAFLVLSLIARPRRARTAASVGDRRPAANPAADADALVRTPA